MSDYDNGMARAQQQYDNQLPPEDEEGDGDYKEENASRAEAYEEWLEKKADMSREESLAELNDPRDIKYWEGKEI